MEEIPKGCPRLEDIQEFFAKRAANPSDPDITLLGRGSYGEAFRYRDWVIKLLDLKDRETKITFDIETETMDKLSHVKELEGYIAPFCWSYEEIGKQGIIVQKFIQSITLEDFLKKYPNLPYNFGAKLLQNLTEGMTRLHAAGYIHRDLKPANILIRAGKDHPEELKTTPILIDFGFACAMPCPDWMRMGTPGYFPENWSSDTNLLRRVGPKGERYTYRNKAYIRKRQRTWKNVVEGHMPAPIKFTNEIAFSRKVGGPGPNWKLLKTRPNALAATYSSRSDAYAMYKIFKQIYDRIDWHGYEKEKGIVSNYMERLRGYQISSLAAQVAREEPENVKERRLEALKRLNSRREARMENRARENAEAALLVGLASDPVNNTRKRKRGKNAPNHLRPQTRQRLEDARRG